MVYDGSAAAAAVIGAGTCYVPPKEHRSNNTIFLPRCPIMTTSSSYILLCSTGAKEQ